MLPVDLEAARELPVLEASAPASPRRAEPRLRSRQRRLATSLAFATLFFAGAALSAGAGDMIAEAVEGTGSTSTEAVQEAASEEQAAEEPAPEATPTEEGTVEEPPAEEPPTDTESEPAGEGTAPPSDDGQGGADGDAGEEPTDPSEDPGDTDPGKGETPDDGEPGQGGGQDEGEAGQDDGGAEPQPEPQGPPLIDDEDSMVTVPVPPDPEVSEAGDGATIWLHRSLPDPTPAARRLAPGFARTLRAESARANADWALVLGVLRTEGRTGRVPADRTRIRALATRLVEAGARKDEWSAVLAVRGRTSFADRAVAAARLHRAVGLQALVTGLEAAKRRLERVTLADSRISIYSAGRADIAAHRIDIRVLVTLRYLAEAFGQVTVSSLQSGHRLYARPGVVSAHIYGLAVDIAALGGLSIIGNQAPGSITEQAVRAVLLLPPGLRARQVISLVGLGGASFALANHDDHIHIGF